MAKTLSQIQKQIDQLQREAEAIRAKEVAGVVARIQEAIAHYGLTAQHLFGADAKSPRAAKAPGKAPAKPKAAKPPAPAKYRDDAGHSWSGHGKRPNWFKAAIAAGKTADELLVKPVA